MASSSAASALPSHSRSIQSQPRPIYALEQTAPNGHIVPGEQALKVDFSETTILDRAVKHLLPGKELIIGRDRTKCQLVLDDPCISAKHLRVYSVVYDASDATEIDTLVYAEDLSRNGTYWNGSLIGRGNGGFLLSPDDVLRLSATVSLTFKCRNATPSTSHFDEVQEMEMERFGSNYIVTDRLLGSGAFGKVLMAIEQTTRTQLACKMVDLRRLRPSIRFGRKETPLPANEVDVKDQLRKVRSWGHQQQRENKLDDKLKIYYREAEILSTIRHPNIIGLEKVFVTDNTIYMFQDLVTGGDLFSYLEKKHGKLSEVEAAVIIRQIVVALCFLHDNDIVHRDLKPDNILMTSLSTGCRVVLTDFGSARRCSSRSRMLSLAGTSEYVAPEVIVDGSDKPGYSRSVDLWSLGCVAAVLLTGASAFTDPTTQQYSEHLAKKCDLASLRRSAEWQAVRPRPKDFVERLLVLAEAERMTAPQALKHDWFSNELHKTNFEELYERTIKHWRARPTRNDLFELSDASSARRIARAEGVIPEKTTDSRQRGPKPSQILESHYKPFPRQLHSSSLWPKRKPSSSYVSPETKAAIDNWPSSGEEDLGDRNMPSSFGLDKSRSRRRRLCSRRLSDPFTSSPSAKERTMTPSRRRAISETHPPPRQVSLPNTPERRSSASMNPFSVPLRLANANAKIALRAEGPEGVSASAPAKLKRRNVMKSPLTPSNERSKKRLASVYDMDEQENDVEMLSQKRPRAACQGDHLELSLPHHQRTNSDEELRGQLR